jgi:hypothetical protein
LQIGRILEVARDFILLCKVSENPHSNTTPHSPLPRPSDSGLTRLSANRDISHLSLKRNSSWIAKKSLISGRGVPFGLFRSVSRLGVQLRQRTTSTFRKIIFNFQVLLICRHRHIQRGHRVPLRLSDRPSSIVGRHRVLAGYWLERGRGGRRRPRGVLKHDAHRSYFSFTKS